MKIKPLKTVGLIGGVSWTSTEEYYKRLNEKVYKKYGDYNSAKVLMYSFNFAEILQHQQNNDTRSESQMLIHQAKALEAAGADMLLICSNTTNKTASEIKGQVHIPIIELIPLTAEMAMLKGYKKLGLIGTKYVMYGEFYKEIFRKYGIEIVVPPKKDGMRVHDIIYDELVKGNFKPESSQTLERIVNDFAHAEVDAVILGCTEIPLVVSQKNVKLPVLDTIEIHVDAAMSQIESKQSSQESENLN